MKKEKKMDLKELTQFFSELSDDKFFSKEQNQWLWHKLNIIAYLMKARGVDKLNLESLGIILKSQNNVALLSGCELESVLSSAKELDESLEEMVDPVQLKMETIVLAEWNQYLTKEDVGFLKKKKESFSLAHIQATLTYVFWAALVFSLWFGIKDKASLWSLIQLCMGFGIVWMMKVMFFKVKNHMEEKSIEKTLTFSEKEKNSAENKYYQDIVGYLNGEMKETNWTSDEDVNTALRTLKSQTIKLSLLLDKNAKKNPNVVESWHYVEKIWKKDIPLLLSNNGDFEDKNKILKTTIIAMQKVLQNYIEDYVYDENIELTAKQKFWVAKASVT